MPTCLPVLRDERGAAGFLQEGFALKKILIGTTNPAKIKKFAQLLSGYAASFYTLGDLDITAEPQEQGKTPEENAVLKARFYGKYFDPVICNDSGLYFDGLALNDPRQPGLNIRTPNGEPRLDDEQMISYYSALIHSLGGKVPAYYLDGAAVYSAGRIYSMMENGGEAAKRTFYMTDRPSPKRHIGWPLDSLSLRRDTLTYFIDEENSPDPAMTGEESDPYEERLTAFLVQALGL